MLKGSTLVAEASTFAVKNNSRNSESTFTPKNPHLKCGTCDKTGHTSETCRAHLRCDYCGWQGHTINVCRKLQKTNSAGNKPGQREPKIFSSKANHANTNAPFTLTAEQYQNVITLLAERKSNSMVNHIGSASAISDFSGTIFCGSVINKEICWILDT